MDRLTEKEVDMYKTNYTIVKGNEVLVMIDMLGKILENDLLDERDRITAGYLQGFLNERTEIDADKIISRRQLEDVQRAIEHPDSV